MPRGAPWVTSAPPRSSRSAQGRFHCRFARVRAQRGFRAAAFGPLGTLRCVAALLAAVGVAAFVNPFRAEAVDPRARAAVVGVAALLLLTALGGVVVGAVVLASTATEGNPVALKRRGEWVLPSSHAAVRWSRSFAFDAFLAVLLGGSILLASVAERLGPERTDALPFRVFFAFLVMLSAGSARGAALHLLLAALSACGGDTSHTRALHEPILAVREAAPKKGAGSVELVVPGLYTRAPVSFFRPPQLVGGVSLLVLLFHVHATARVAFVERQLFRRAWSRSGAEALNWHRLAGETFFFREQHLKESVSRAVMESTIGYASHEVRPDCRARLFSRERVRRFTHSLRPHPRSDAPLQIRNPLFVLKNLGQDLLERRAHTEDEEDLRAILRAVEHMIRVTRCVSNRPRELRSCVRARQNETSILSCGWTRSDVLDHQKLVNGKLQIALGPCELRRTTESLVDTHSRGSGSPIHCVFDEDLPPLVWTDELRLSQILTNALANATRHLGGGDRASLSVFVRVLPASEPHSSAAVRVEVRNSSEEGLGGVPAETLFAPFEQGHSPQETLARGTGLGLPICRLLAELLGGRVDLFDEPVTRPEEELRARHSAASSPTFAAAIPEPARYPTGTVRGRVVVQTLAEEDAMRIHRQRFLFDVHGLRTTCFALELPLALPPPRVSTPSKPPTPSSPASPCASAGSLVQLLPSHRAPILAAPTSIPTTRPPRAPRHRGPGSATKLGLTVLVVDDDPVRRVAERQRLAGLRPTT